MLLGLHGLIDDYSHVFDKILGSRIVSNFTFTCSILMCVPSKHITGISTHVDDSFALVSKRNDHTCPHKPSKRVSQV